MRTLSRVLGVSAFLVLGVLPPLAAQRVISPDSLRYPTIMDSTAQVRLEAVVRLRVAELARAIQRADTLMLIQVLGDAEISAGELAAARAQGCPSLGWALSEVLRGRGRGTGLDAVRQPPLGRVTVTIRELVLSDPVAVIAFVRIEDVITRPRQYADFSVEFERIEDALLSRRALGLWAALCGLALAAP